ncbi:MAG TPA: tRNA (N6-threonylcarbamoyladenosine(37)-N6)-methyltransferase TrmO [Chryseolinea sp.]
MLNLNVKTIGTVESRLTRREDCPLQGDEGGTEAWLNINEEYIEATDGINAGMEVILITWLHLADRNVLKCYPRNDVNAPHVGVFKTRSPDRPNPLGLHPVKILAVQGARLKVYPLEAVDGTLLIDIKPSL